MCLLVLAWQAAPRYRLVVAANRDEYHERPAAALAKWRSEEHTSELQSQSNLVCRLLLEKKKNTKRAHSLNHSTIILHTNLMHYKALKKFLDVNLVSGSSVVDLPAIHPYKVDPPGFGVLR